LFNFCFIKKKQKIVGGVARVADPYSVYTVQIRIQYFLKVLNPAPHFANKKFESSFEQFSTILKSFMRERKRMLQKIFLEMFNVLTID
jgi:hypothetical protein